MDSFSPEKNPGLNSLLYVLCIFCPLSFCCVGLKPCLTEGCSMNLFLSVSMSVPLCVWCCLCVSVFLLYELCVSVCEWCLLCELS